MSWGQFKPVLTDALVMHLQPIQVTLHRIVILYSRNLSFSLLLGLTCSLALQEKYAEVVADPVYLDSILAEGAAKANLIADSTLQNVYNAMGFLPKKKPIVI